ncbi:MAG: type II toxin-antitoxin system VapC family toxin [Candidatus Aminicenantes bacterium]|nr:type II toxin-antitoxin system VapC family toxin [Candidatus Aminicenantes bacterium]
MKTKLYLDTSIPSAYYDYSKPLRQLITQKWFENETHLFDVYISVLTIEEIDRLGNITRRENIKNLILKYNVEILQISDEIKNLAEKYITKGAIPKSEPEDALHIAIATVNKIEGLASWNFKHIVSINPIRKIHEINGEKGYPLLEIGSLELYGGSKYGNL